MILKKPVLVFVLLFSIALCSNSFGLPNVALQNEASGKTIALGIVSYADPSEQYAAMTPLINFLNQRTNLQISLKLYPDYYSILSDIDHENLDLAILSPVVYTLCLDDPSLQFLGTALVNNKKFYHSLLLTRKDSNIRSVSDLAGKTIGFVSRYSASGYVYPAVFLKSAGLVKEGKPLYKSVFLASHHRNLRALEEKKVDAIAAYDAYFPYTGGSVDANGVPKLDKFRVLKLIENQIPESAIVCRSDMDKDSINKLREALKAIGQKGVPKNLFYSSIASDNKAAYQAVKAFISLEEGLTK